MSEETKKDDGVVQETIADPINFDTAKSYLENNLDGQKYLQSIGDTATTKGIETFKTNHTKEIEERIRKDLNPKETQEQIDIRELKAINADNVKLLAQNKLRDFARLELVEFGLEGYANMNFGNSVETIRAEVAAFASKLNASVETKTAAQLGASGRDTPDSPEKKDLGDINKQIADAEAKGDYNASRLLKYKLKEG